MRLEGYYTRIAAKAKATLYDNGKTRSKFDVSMARQKVIL